MKNLALIVFTLSFTFGMAQKDAVYKEIAKKTCACLDDKKLTAENLENNLGLCMMNVISENSKLTKDLDLSSAKSIEKLGENVGIQMAFICPEVFMLMLEEEESLNKVETEFNYGLIEEYFNFGDLNYFNLKDGNGKTIEYIWFRPFEGDAEVLKMLKNKMLVGSKATIEHRNIEIFNGKLGEYVIKREIRSIKF